MTHRSTRNKLRYQVTLAMGNCDKILGHLRYLEEIADGRSEYITTTLPMLVAAADALRGAFASFRERL